VNDCSHWRKFQLASETASSL